MSAQLWDSSSPFTARLATATDELNYYCMNEGLSDSDSKSIWYFYGDVVADFCNARRDELKDKAA
jgi:hypothetical protein